MHTLLTNVSLPSTVNPSNTTSSLNLTLSPNYTLWDIQYRAANGDLLDGGLILYVGLLILFVWRFVCYWRCGGAWIQYANYCVLLLLLLLAVDTYDIGKFAYAASSMAGKSEWEELPGWLRPLILAGPFISVVTFCTCAFQTFQTVERIRDDSAVHRRDRAVQIILLPAVYVATAMSSLTRLYKLIIAGGDVPQEEIELQLLKSETCLWVGDLYEAWALYQFGKLTLELIESAIAKQGRSEEPSERAAARALTVTHSAVESLAWVGIWAFLIVCVLQAGVALWIFTFTPVTSQVESFNDSMSQFAAAGFLASCAAIYNVFTVEDTFHHFLTAYCPFLKFLTVKILVTFAWVQRGFFQVCQGIQHSFWPGMKDVPVIGAVLKLKPVEFEVFYVCLLIIECFLVALTHLWAWNVSEEWYEESDAIMKEVEKEVRAAGFPSLSGEPPASGLLSRA